MSNHLAPSIDYTVVKNLVSSSEYQGFVDYIEAPSKGGKILKGSQQKNSHGHLYGLLILKMSIQAMHFFYGSEQHLRQNQH